MKKTNEPPKRATTRGEIKFSNPSSHEKHINNEKGGPFVRTSSLNEPSPIAIALHIVKDVMVVKRP
jgi:hypothetical protein